MASINRLNASMRRRCQAVIDNRGSFTRYWLCKLAHWLRQVTECNVGNCGHNVSAYTDFSVL
jgi:hypothetical protein